MPISGAASPLALPVLNLPATGARGMPRMLGEDMDKPADGRGSTGSTDGTKAKAMSGKTGCRAYRHPTQSVFAHALTLAAIVVLYNWFGQTYLLGLQFAYVFLYFLLGLLIAPITALAVTAFFRVTSSLGRRSSASWSRPTV